MKRIVLAFFLISLVFISAKAQHHHFDNLEVQLGFKNFKVDPGSMFFRHDTLFPDTAFIQGRNNIGAPNLLTILSIGYEAEVYDDLFLSIKTEFNTKGVPGMGVQLGMGYRLNLNYFMRLQGEFLLSWGMVTDTMGSTSYSPSPLMLQGIRFADTAQITSFYRGQQYGFQPKITLVADITSRLEFRATMMYQIALVNNQAVVIEGAIGPSQTEKVVLPFRDENTVVTFDDLIPEKALYRPSGFSARAGFAYKIIR